MKWYWFGIRNTNFLAGRILTCCQWLNFTTALQWQWICLSFCWDTVNGNRPESISFYNSLYSEFLIIFSCLIATVLTIPFNCFLSDRTRVMLLTMETNNNDNTSICLGIYFSISRKKGSSGILWQFDNIIIIKIPESPPAGWSKRIEILSSVWETQWVDMILFQIKNSRIAGNILSVQRAWVDCP